MVRAVLFYVLLGFSLSCCFMPNGEKKLYMSTERPVIYFIHPKYLSYANMTAVRYGRRDPQYYINFHITTLFTAGNNVTIHFWFYEYYHSHYHRSFLEMSFKWCNLVYKDPIFGAAMRKYLPKSCPHKPGEYHLYNMTASVGAIPELPFIKGRIYANFTLDDETIGSGYVDIEFKRKILPSN